MGLIGPQGTDPFALDQGEIVTGVFETPLKGIPTVSEWGMIVLTLSLLTAGTLVLARLQQTT